MFTVAMIKENENIKNVENFLFVRLAYCQQHYHSKL